MNDAPTQALHLRLLGAFDLTLDAQPIPMRRPAQRLLAYLAVHHERPVHRMILWERLWGEADPRRASSSLRSTLWRLPRLRGRSLVTSTPTHVRLAPGVRVDLWDSRRIADTLVTRGLPQPPEHGLVLCDLLKQDLLPEWYDEWLTFERENYRQLRLHALDRLSGCLHFAGHHAAAVHAGLMSVAGEPLRESAHRRVIEAHLAEGNHAEALRQYESYRRLLAVELGLPPSRAIRELVAPLLGRPLDTV